MRGWANLPGGLLPAFHADAAQIPQFAMIPPDTGRRRPSRRVRFGLLEEILEKLLESLSSFFAKIRLQ
jgi:hypothetical protein